MSLAFDVQTFQIPTNAAGHNFFVDFTRLGGLTPKAAWVLMSGRSEALGVDGNSEQTTMFAYGMATAASTRRGNTILSQDAQATGVEAQVQRGDGLLFEIDSTPTVIGRLDLSAFLPDRVRFSISLQFSKVYTATVAVLAGTDITNATIVDANVATSTGPTTVSSPGFQAEFCSFMFIGNTGALPLTQTQPRFGIGFGVPRDGTNICWTGVTQRTNPSNTVGYASDTECIQFGAGKMHVSGTDPNGFVYNTDVAFAGTYAYSVMCLGGANLRAKISALTTQFSGANRTIAPQINLVGGFALSANRANSTGGASTNPCEGSWGAFVGPQNNPAVASHGILNQHNVTPTVVSDWIRQSDLYANSTTAFAFDGAIRPVVQQNLPNQFVVKEQIADSSANFIGIASIGLARLFFVDGDAQSSRSTIAIQDGGALTLTNAVRVLWDDTVPNAELVPAIKRLAEAIVQQTG